MLWSNHVLTHYIFGSHHIQLNFQLSIWWDCYASATHFEINNTPYIFVSSHHSQSLNLGGRRGTTDGVETIPFHPSLSSAALKESPNPIPIHSLMLSSHLFLCLPLPIHINLLQIFPFHFVYLRALVTLHVVVSSSQPSCNKEAIEMVWLVLGSHRDGLVSARKP